MMSGATLQVGGRDIPLLPLNYKQLKAQKDNIRLLGVGGFTDAFHIFDTLAPVIHASLQRTVPQLTLDDVEEALDQPTAVVLANEVIRISFPQAPVGETTAEGASGDLGSAVAPVQPTPPWTLPASGDFYFKGPIMDDFEQIVFRSGALFAKGMGVNIGSIRVATQAVGKLSLGIFNR